jgi:hypothetical protein
MLVVAAVRKMAPVKAQGVNRIKGLGLDKVPNKIAREAS